MYWLVQFFLFFSFTLFAQEQGDLLKKEIEQIQAALSTATDDKVSLLKKDLAIAYYKDQNQEKAFQLFLEACDLSLKKSDQISDEEAKLYEDALKLYLDSALSTKKQAERILEQYGKVMDKHPNYVQLGYLVALSYANQNDFIRFFELFYKSYAACPEHFLAYRTKGILNGKLFSFAKTMAGKETYRKNVVGCLISALEKGPDDLSLYKVLLANVKSEDHATISLCLNKIIDRNIIIPRAEICFFFQKIIDARLFDLAQRFLNQAHQWYPESRILDDLQGKINK